MEKEDILKQFDMMALRQTKIIVDNQAIDVKMTRQSQHLEKTLDEVSNLRNQVTELRDKLG